MVAVQSSNVESDYVRGGTQKADYTADDVVAWSCPLCHSDSVEVIKMERGALRVVRCNGCTLMRVSPRVHQPEECYQGDVALYEQEYREIVHNGRPHHRDVNYQRTIDILLKHKPCGKFLDIGTSTGAFLRHARNRDWELTGVEPSPQLGSLAKKWWGLNIVQGFLEQLDLPENNFDIVTMTDVFEHVVNPREVLGAVHRVLKPDGIVLIKVPNGLFNLMKYKTRKLMGKKGESDDFDAYEHVLHYSEVTLAKMVEACGFEPIEIFPEAPVQLPVWHQYVGQYYQHASPFFMSPRINAARAAVYRASLLERALKGKVGYLAPNIGCVARPKK